VTVLKAVESIEDIPAVYRGTPISNFLEYHNLNRPFETFTSAQILIGMCMDSRKHLHIPDNFAFILRAGGANLRYSEFKVSYAVAVGGVRALALIGHTQCGMVNLVARKNAFIQGLVEGAGWDAVRAEEHFGQFAPMFEIGNEADFILSEIRRLRERYPKLVMAPMIYKVEDNRLYLLEEGAS